MPSPLQYSSAASINACVAVSPVAARIEEDEVKSVQSPVFLEVARASVIERSVSLCVSLAIHVLLLFLLVVRIPMYSARPKPVPGQHVTQLVAPARIGAPADPTPTNTQRISQDHTTVPRNPAQVHEPVPNPVPGVRARISVQFDFDREQNLPYVLYNVGGHLGLGDDRVISRLFNAPNWVAVPLPPYGVAINAFYHLKLDESHGRYRFIDQLRAREHDLDDLQAYALFDFTFQDRLEKEVRAAIPTACMQAEELRAIVKFDRTTDIKVTDVSCGGARTPRPQ